MHRHFLKTLLVAILVCLPAVSGASWEAIGPEGGEVKSVIESSTTPGVLYAASGSYPTIIVKSDDGGLNWGQVGSYSGYNYCMAMGPDGVLVAGGSSASYRSTDGGATWTTHSMSNTYFQDMEAHPTDPSVYFAAGYSYISSQWRMVFLKSTDGGISWTPTELLSEYSFGRCVAVSISNPDIVYVGGNSQVASPYDPKLFKSTDGGSSFTEVVNTGWQDDYYMYGLAVHPTNPQIVIAASYYAIFRTTDGGASWSEVASYYYYNWDVDFSTADPDYVYSAGYTQVYRSTNAGQSWTKISTGLTGVSNLRDVATTSSDASQAYAGAGTGFYRSDDYGASWTESCSGLLLGKVTAYGLCPSDPLTIYVSMSGIGEFKTTNGGDSWTEVSTPLACGDLCAMVTHPTNPDIVFGLEGGG